MRIAIALLCPFFLAATASAGPIQSLAFHFANDGSPAYRYVSGDILFEATAELAGSLVLDYDTVSGNDTIRQIEGRLDSPLQILGHYPVEMSWLAGADLVVTCRGLGNHVVTPADVLRPATYLDLSLKRDVDP